MRSSSGLYVSRLDHVRALAAFLVYFWHFVHVNVPFSYVPDFAPLSLLEEGHVGVALFMVLSGYLFAKIIDGKPISLLNFYWNRMLRLLPLLVVVLIYWYLRGWFPLHDLILGLILPNWPGGTWSIVVELHFYLLLPFILMLQRHNRYAPLFGLLAIALSARLFVWSMDWNIRTVAYFTIGGCIDLFVMGMLWFELSRFEWVRRHGLLLAGSALSAFIVCWHYFNLAGGFYGTGPGSGREWIWILTPALQGLTFGAFIVGYENARFKVPEVIDWTLARIGEYSYSIYLLHFIVFSFMAKSLAATGLPMAKFHVSALLAITTFPAIVLVGAASYHFFEKPFLRLRRRYGAGASAIASQPA